MHSSEASVGAVCGGFGFGVALQSPRAPQKVDGPLVEGRGAVRYQPGPVAGLLAHASANRCSSWQRASFYGRHTWRLRSSAR